MKFLICLASFLTLFNKTVVATTLTETFSTADNKSSAITSTAVWNTTSGLVHPPLRVGSWGTTSPYSNTNFSVGDGSHGAFINSRYALFDDDGNTAGNIITINTDTYSDLNFTSFTLDNGWTLRPSGSRPLIIRSLSTITVNGTIDCSGNNGADLNNTNTATPGGTARCGGGAGGAGGLNGQNGSSGSISTRIDYGGAGTIPTPTVSGGGTGGNSAVSNMGSGGGGGAYSSVAASAGANNFSAGGAAGSIEVDHGFTVIAGGTGGGGGGGNSNGAGSTGGGGGAGGGVVLIYAVGNVSVSATGTINANGGNGGGPSGSTFLGGGGGGGGGGSIIIFSGGVVTLDGAVTATRGSRTYAGAGSEGRGAQGRTWIVDSTITSPGNCNAGGSVTEDPVSLIPNVGCTEYQASTFYAYSKIFSISESDPRILSASVNKTVTGSSEASIEISGSNDSFVNSDSGWKTSAQLSSLAGFPFFRYRVKLVNDQTSNFARVDDITIETNSTRTQNFEFKSTGCGLIGGPRMPLIFLIPLIVFAILRPRRARIPSPQKS